MKQVPPSRWEGQYGTPEGPAKIDARRLYSTFLERGAPEVDLEVLAMTVAGMLGVPPDATIVDVGSSYPYFLREWRVDNNHTGRLIGIEPNAEQFRELPYRRPHVLEGGGYEFELVAAEGADNSYQIELYEADANHIPLGDELADVVSAMLMMYHVPKRSQQGAMREMKRVLKTDGIFLLSTRGSEYKTTMNQARRNIAMVLSEIMEQTVMSPAPTNSGFTAEHAAEFLPRYFQHVIELTHRSKLVFEDERGVEVFLADCRSLRDVYQDEQGRQPTEQQFERALWRVLGERVLRIETQSEPIVDTLQESLFIAADRPIEVAEERLVIPGILDIRRLV